MKESEIVDTKFFRMQPAEISVTVITREMMSEVKDFFGLHRNLFPAFKESYSDQLKIINNELVIVDVQDKYFSEPPEPRFVVKPGMFYLVSNNGARHFTSDARVKHGMMFDVPEELMRPVYGDPISGFSV